MFPILENLRGFFSSRPPLVVFMICLGSFAIALMSFAYIVKVKDIPNPDIKMDWNTFLDTFSKLEMCLPENASNQERFTNSSGDKISLADLTAADVYSSLNEMISKTINLAGITNQHVYVTNKDTSTSLKKNAALSSKATVAPTQALDHPDYTYLNLTIAMNVDIYLTHGAAPDVITGSTQYISLITGRQMSFKGKYVDSEMAVTLTFPFNLTAGTCKEWVGRNCIKYSVTVCANFQGPTFLFPGTQSPSSSEVCSIKQSTMAEKSPIRMMTTQIVGQQYHWCHKGIHISPSFSFDESLTVLLSLEDRSIINLHLMRTSYFLFVMVVTFFCYAMIRGRPAKLKAAHIAYVEKVATHP